MSPNFPSLPLELVPREASPSLEVHRAVVEGTLPLPVEQMREDALPVHQTVVEGTALNRHPSCFVRLCSLHKHWRRFWADWRLKRLIARVPARQEAWELEAWNFAARNQLPPEIVSQFLWHVREVGTVEILDRNPARLLMAYCEGRTCRAKRDELAAKEHAQRESEKEPDSHD